MMDGGYPVVLLEYDPNCNTITHEDGRVIDDVSNLISHEELSYLKQVGGTKYIKSDEDGVIYELTAPIPEDDYAVTFSYNKKRNVMLDDEGYVMFNIFAYISPQDLMLFKEKKEDMCIYGVHGRLVELIYNVDEMKH